MENVTVIVFFIIESRFGFILSVFDKCILVTARLIIALSHLQGLHGEVP